MARASGAATDGSSVAIALIEAPALLVDAVALDAVAFPSAAVDVDPPDAAAPLASVVLGLDAVAVEPVPELEPAVFAAGAGRLPA